MLALAAGALGLAVTLTPVGVRLEEDLGLPVLFRLRGPVPPPPEVMVVSLDRASADALNLPPDPARWPRTFHARLVDVLAREGAAVIAFDLFFEQAREPVEDAALADALRRAGNVLLAAYLVQASVPLGAGPPGTAVVEQVIQPLSLLAEAARASAPFPLPKVPVRVSQYWAFKTSGGDVPTLPVAALQAFGLDAYPDLVRVLEEAGVRRAPSLPASREALPPGALTETLVALRGVLQADPEGAARARRLAAEAVDATADPRRARLLRALAGAYLGPDSRYLNFYGPAGAIPTLPYHQAIRPADRSRFEGKAVFVGISAVLRPEISDTFYAVFSEEGADISGVEIAATAFANLLEDRPVRPLEPWTHLGLVLAGGVLFGVLCGWLPPGAAAAALLMVVGVYVAGAARAFASAALWSPLAVPLGLQAPGVFLAATLWRYAETRRERDRVRRAFAYYLPEEVIDRLVTTVTAPAAGAQPVYGVCLATDAGRYTSLSESLAPADLARLMNDYYAAIFEPIRRRGGVVSDVVGDAALAIWAGAEPDAVLRERACLAACELVEAVDRFNGAAPGGQLPTRVGLHSGTIVLGHVGALDHYEYRAVGDIVNTASRIEGLNKRLGTRVLVSDEVARGLEGFLARRVGTFLLAGKARPIVLHELVCRDEEASAGRRAAAARFAEALALYEAGRLDEATDRFEALAAASGGDGVARFYALRCRRVAAAGREEPWSALVRLEEK